MPDAMVMVRDAPHYRSDAFCDGLAARGYRIVQRIANPQPDDVLVVWCRYGDTHREATRFEQAGARVIVAENGYFGRDWRGQIWYALSLNWHAGHGTWNVGDPSRARSMFAPEPWRVGSRPFVLLGQRGIGVEPVVAPRGWYARVLSQLQAARVPVVYREHPGRDHDTVGLLAQLHESRGAITWSSGAALKAIVHGTPVYHGMRDWIGALAAQRFALPLPEPFVGDRWPMLERLAWAMFELSEIQSGYAFNHLLR